MSNSQDDDRMPNHCRFVCRTHKMMMVCRCVIRLDSRVHDDSMAMYLSRGGRGHKMMKAWRCVTVKVSVEVTSMIHKMMIAWRCVCLTHKMIATSTHALEKCFENAFWNVCLAFQTLRLEGLSYRRLVSTVVWAHKFRPRPERATFSLVTVNGRFVAWDSNTNIVVI